MCSHSLHPKWYTVLFFYLPISPGNIPWILSCFRMCCSTTVFLTAVGISFNQSPFGGHLQCWQSLYVYVSLHFMFALLLLYFKFLSCFLEICFLLCLYIYMCVCVCIYIYVYILCVCVQNIIYFASCPAKLKMFTALAFIEQKCQFLIYTIIQLSCVFVVKLFTI